MSNRRSRGGYKYRRLQNAAGDLGNMLTQYQKGYRNKAVNKQNLKNTIEKTMDSTKQILLEMIDSDEDLNNQNVVGSGLGVGAVTSSKKSNEKQSFPWDEITLDSSQSDIIASDCGLAVSAGDTSPETEVGEDTFLVADGEDCETAFLRFIGNKLKSFFQWLWEKIKQMAQAVKDAVCKFFATIWGWVESAAAHLTGSRSAQYSLIGKCHTA